MVNLEDLSFQQEFPITAAIPNGLQGILVIYLDLGSHVSWNPNAVDVRAFFPVMALVLSPQPAALTLPDVVLFKNLLQLLVGSLSHYLFLMKSKLLAALQHVVVADRALHDSGNLRSIIQRKKLDQVLKIADCWYELPFTDKGKEAVQKAIDMGRDAREKTIYRIAFKSYFIYFIGSEDDIITKLDALPEAKEVKKQDKELKDAAPNMSEQTSPKLSD